MYDVLLLQLFDSLARAGYIDRHAVEDSLIKRRIPKTKLSTAFQSAFAKQEKLSYADFVALVNPEREAHIRKIFQDADPNMDGFLSPTDVATVFKALGQPLSDKELRRLIAALDRDSDGNISYPEFLSAVVVTMPLPATPIGENSSAPKASDLWLAIFDSGAESTPAQASALSTQAQQSKDAFAKFREQFAQEYAELIAAAQTFLAGGIAGAVSRTAVAPLERLKIMCVAAAGTRSRKQQR